MPLSDSVLMLALVSLLLWGRPVWRLQRVLDCWGQQSPSPRKGVLRAQHPHPGRSIRDPAKTA
eukprot:4993531-Alexandrium_andersonii.AAC.1